jgi:hypothetical protein
VNTPQCYITRPLPISSIITWMRQLTFFLRQELHLQLDIFHVIERTKTWRTYLISEVIKDHQQIFLQSINSGTAHTPSWNIVYLSSYYIYCQVSKLGPWNLPSQCICMLYRFLNISRLSYQYGTQWLLRLRSLYCVLSHVRVWAESLYVPWFGLVFKILKFSSSCKNKWQNVLVSDFLFQLF